MQKIFLKSLRSNYSYNNIIMAEQFWHDRITDLSFAFVQHLRSQFTFVLIGGWAVYLYTKTLKSKDIDIIVDFDELGKMRERFLLVKNDRLQKYEIKGEGFDVDIYVPHWSFVGLPADFVMDHAVALQGFRVPEKEILLALKLFVYTQRKGSLKGKKDMLDVISMLYHAEPRLDRMRAILREHHTAPIESELREILRATHEVPELGLNQKQFADFKKPLLKELDR
ncbi:MAG: hypothetical protein HY007_03545 [Candidatus Sungbacteria bacterium]|nr:hypothetical protein [Candidatus Sungbacteria bacterium]